MLLYQPGSVLTIRVSHAASVMGDLYSSQDQFVGAFFEAVKIKAMPDSEGKLRCFRSESTLRQRRVGCQRCCPTPITNPNL